MTQTRKLFLTCVVKLSGDETKTSNTPSAGDAKQRKNEKQRKKVKPKQTKKISQRCKNILKFFSSRENGKIAHDEPEDAFPRYKRAVLRSRRRNIALNFCLPLFPTIKREKAFSLTISTIFPNEIIRGVDISRSGMSRCC